jgi:hypothetical protein
MPTNDADFLAGADLDYKSLVMKLILDRSKACTNPIIADSAPAWANSAW